MCCKQLSWITQETKISRSCENFPVNETDRKLAVSSHLTHSEIIRWNCHRMLERDTVVFCSMETLELRSTMNSVNPKRCSDPEAIKECDLYWTSCWFVILGFWKNSRFWRNLNRKLGAKSRKSCRNTNFHIKRANFAPFVDLVRHTTENPVNPKRCDRDSRVSSEPKIGGKSSEFYHCVRLSMGQITSSRY